MREIKFRAWHHGAGDPRVSGHMVYSQPFPVKFWTNVENEPLAVEVMQFTGLKDKNGVDIYEGDVVRIFHEDYADEEDEHSVGKVAYNLFGDYPAFDIYVKTCRSVSMFESYSDEFNSFTCPDYVIEVIGNIYENPELLESPN